MPVSLENYIMVHGPRDFPNAATSLVETTLGHPFYQEALADSTNKLHLVNITGYCFETGNIINEEEQVVLSQYFCEIFRKKRKLHTV